jgi:NTE family protein
MLTFRESLSFFLPDPPDKMMARGDQTMKIGLALGGGTLRGAAHIGILEVLLEAGIRPDIIAGTSSGCVIASLYAHGISPLLMAKLAQSFPGHQLLDWATSTRDALRFLFHLPLLLFGLRIDLARFVPLGFVRGQKFEQYLQTLFQLTPTLPRTPLLVTTVDLYTAEAVIFTEGLDLRYELPGTRFEPMTPSDKIACIRASCSMPGVFTPRQIGKRLLVDGAVRMLIPADILYQIGCDKVIVVDLLKPEMVHVNPVRTFLDVLSRSWEIVANEYTVRQLQDDKLFPIQPNIENDNMTSFEKIEYYIERGRIAARTALPALREYLKKPTL